MKMNIFVMHKILFAGTIIFSGCSRIKLNLGKELNVTSSLPPVLLNILQGLLNILQTSTWLTD